MNGVLKVLLYPFAILTLLFWIAYASLLYCPLMVLTFLFTPILGAKRVWIWNSKLVHIYWVHLTTWFEKYVGVTYHFSGDKIPKRESVIMMSNHQSFIDWLMMFPFALRQGRLGCCNFFAKDSVKYIPGMGWGIYLKGSVMLKRDWNKDKERIEETFKHITSHKVPIWLITHPEGTRLSKEKLSKSHDWAKKKDLPIFNNVLLPRSQGFIATIQGIGDVIDAVYDVTIGFDGNKIFDLPDAVLPFTGRHTHLHVRRFPIDTIPRDPIELDKWLLDVWSEKEKLMEEFKKNGKFPNEYDYPYVNEPLNI